MQLCYRFAGITGKLEKEKADIILINLIDWSPGWTAVPLLEAFIHRVRGTDVQTAIIDGKLVMYNREIITINKKELFKEIAKNASLGQTNEQKSWAFFK